MPDSFVAIAGGKLCIFTLSSDKQACHCHSDVVRTQAVTCRYAEILHLHATGKPFVVRVIPIFTRMATDSSGLTYRKRMRCLLANTLAHNDKDLQGAHI